MLIPIGHEDQQVTRLPWVTILLVTINVVVFLFTNQAVQRQSGETRQRAREIVRYANEHPYLRVPPEIRRAVPAVAPRTDVAPDVVAEEQARLDAMWDNLKSSTKHTVFRNFGYVPAEPSLLALFTSMFLHGGWLHLLGNMLFLWLAGGSLEDRWGRLFYPVFYLAGGVVAALIHGVMTPQSSAPMVGASGAIAALMGAFLVRLATTRIRFFYWLLIFRGTFAMPAYVALPLWLLQQFAMARFGVGGGIAVWAHIGGFVFGALVAVVIRLSDVEKNILAPAIAKKTTWNPSEHLTTALEKMDRGDAEAGIQDLVAVLKRNPNNIEARAALVGAHTQAGDTLAAARESARLVSAYVVARDLDGGLAALEEHLRAHRNAPVALRSLLALAGQREKQERHREAADLYRTAVESWPDDPLVSKALIAHGRLALEVFNEPDETLALLEGVVASPQTTPEFRRAAEELMTAARRMQRAPASPPEATSSAGAFEPTSLTAEPPEPPPAEEPAYATGVEMPSLATEAVPSAPEIVPAPETVPAPVPVESAVAVLAVEEPATDLPPDTPVAPPTWTLLPVSMRAVDIDARGLRLQNRAGKTGHLAWPNVAGIAVARIGNPGATEPSGDELILDLLTAPKSNPEGEVVRCVRLTGTDLALPQLQAEPSPVRRIQRLVATMLKATGATPYPSREDCLGMRGFPTFADLEQYETALVTCLRLTAVSPAAGSDGER